MLRELGLKKMRTVASTKNKLEQLHKKYSPCIYSRQDAPSLGDRNVLGKTVNVKGKCKYYEPLLLCQDVHVLFNLSAIAVITRRMANGP